MTRLATRGQYLLLVLLLGDESGLDAAASLKERLSLGSLGRVVGEDASNVDTRKHKPIGQQLDMSQTVCYEDKDHDSKKNNNDEDTDEYKYDEEDKDHNNEKDNNEDKDEGKYDEEDKDTIMRKIIMKIRMRTNMMRRTRTQ